jgi:acyl-CoA reductase-like NAD-dependent aldehyde dehydrogenase
MVASIKPHRDELGLSDGLMLIDGTWSAAQDGKTWDHSHPATGAGRLVPGRRARRRGPGGARDIKRAMRMTKAIRAGTVGINGYQLEPHAAFGGYNQSGLGREGGRAAVEAYTELKTVLLPFTDEMM